MKKINKLKKYKKIIFIILSAIILYAIIDLIIIFILSRGFNDKYEITTSLSEYNNVIGNGKWGMSEKIFPKDINNLNVKDFKYVYYDPFDANYLSYLVIDYNEEDYEKEINRLKECGITNYIGYYGVTGFENYTLLAMNADSYNGFIYAITDNKSKIIYVELVFCNYYMDIKYNEQIPNEYLPIGFDATIDNEYLKKH